MNEISEDISISYTVVRPGGNDTVLFDGVIKDPTVRKTLNDVIMGFYPNVEQVGFTSTNEESELLMAGGEFCGNATRSTAWLALKQRPGRLLIKTSSVEKKLIAGVATIGEAFSQMPVYEDAEKVKQDSTGNKSFIVELEGITQYVTFDTQPIEGKTEAEIKSIAKKLLDKKGLTVFPAAGVIYSEKSSRGWEIKPVVYVRDINTLFYETGCASGTTALGLVLAKQLGGSITEVPVYQPSGLPMKISVGFDGEKFNYAEISGPIEFLVKGRLEIKNKLSYVVEAVGSQQQLNKALEAEGLISLYQEIFAGYPYFEKFSEDEIRASFQEYLKKGLLFLAKDQNSVIGFGAALPLSEVPSLVNLCKQQGINPAKTWYMADLGVASNLRRNGIAKALVKARLNSIPKGATVLMRTSENNVSSQSLYIGLGFTEIKGMYENVEQKRVGGTIQKDRRIFLVRSS